jgi:DNA-binding Lrp family transcriptional regulator
MMIELSSTDRAILELLQQSGRLTNAEVASRINLSPPACWKRLKRLEQDVIEGYHASLKRKALGLNVFAFISITLCSHSTDAAQQFEKEILDLRNVLACHNISGKSDYLLQVVARDFEDFQEVVMKRIQSLSYVKAMNTGFSLREVKRSGNLPI